MGTMFWFNYETGNFEEREAPATDAEAMVLIPQQPAACGLYRCYRDLGMPILEAMANVLSQCVGDPIPFPVPVEVT